MKCKLYMDKLTVTYFNKRVGDIAKIELRKMLVTLCLVL